MSLKAPQLTNSLLGRIAIVCLAVMIAFASAELFVRYILKYPYQVMGTRKYQIHNKLGPYNVITWRPAYYRYLSIEGNNKIFGFNNIGLPGTDYNKDYQSNIFVLGSSFIEAKNVKNTDLATSHFQGYLDSINAQTNVINLGSSGHDPYVMWHRLKFFEQELKHNFTIVVIDPLSLTYLSNRWTDSLSFDALAGYPKEIPQRPIVKLAAIPRRYSSALNLLLQGFASKENLNEDKPQKQTEAQNQGAWSKLEQCIAMYSSNYTPNVLLLSIIPDVDTNDKIKEICLKYNCNFTSNETIIQPKYQTNGSGHLNENGNQVLGKFLFESYQKYCM
jgi:hypothetical protein